MKINIKVQCFGMYWVGNQRYDIPTIRFYSEKTVTRDFKFDGNSKITIKYFVGYKKELDSVNKIRMFNRKFSVVSKLLKEIKDI